MASQDTEDVRSNDLEQGCLTPDQRSSAAKVGGGAFCACLLAFIIVICVSIKRVGPEEQLIFITTMGKTTKDGPFTEIVWPHQRWEKRSATRLGPREYAVVKNSKSGEMRHEEGPMLLFLGAWDDYHKVQVKDKVVLQKQEFMRLVDSLSGSERVVVGPITFVPAPLEQSSKGIERAVVVGKENSVLVRSKSTGVKRVVLEEGVFTPEPYEEVLETRDALLLGPKQFAILKDQLTGVFRNEEGPQLLKLQAYDELKEVKSKVVLEKGEYQRLVDARNGAERILSGPVTFVPLPSESAVAGTQNSVFLNAETAVLVLNKTTGQQQLITENGVFTPRSYEHVVEVRTKIRLLPHEAIVVRDTDGATTVHSAGDAFFLPPYSSVLEMEWSSYARPGNQAKVAVNKIDLRARKMFFAYEVRTSDNVKLSLEGTIFWQVKSVTTMVQMTADPEGDVWHHAGSALIQAVSKSTLDQFMSGFSNITAEAFTAQALDGFYDERGVELKSLELTRFDCVDPTTSAILQQIIQETTNRINQLQAQESENEVAAAKMRADIRLEMQRKELIEAQAENARLEAEMVGQSDGTKLVQRAATFITGLNEAVPLVENRLELYKLHEQLKSRNIDTANLAGGTAKLFLTPSDVNLRLDMAKEGGNEL